LQDDIKKEFLPLLLVFASSQRSKMGKFFSFFFFYSIFYAHSLPSLLYLAFSAKRHTQRDDHTSSFWYDLCQKFVNGKFKSQSAFLRSEESGQAVSLKHQSTFN
jgi:hypothetical protein